LSVVRVVGVFRESDVPPLAASAAANRSFAANHKHLDAITLNRTLVLAPPVTLWPYVEHRGELPPDLEEVVAALEHAV
jgi:hypothetical protein